MSSANESFVLVSPSILSANPLKLAAELAEVEEAGADWHHIDVMDGHFVPNLTFGLPLIRAVKRVSRIPLDVHIMIENPDETALSYVEAGADILTFHVEAARHPHRLLGLIREAGAKAGIALNPGTPLASVEALLPCVDMVLLMSVNPGFGGQSFIPQTSGRVRQLRDMLNQRLYGKILIQVDGGINQETACSVRKEGADCLVAGSWVYGAQNRKEAVAALRL